VDGWIEKERKKRTDGWMDGYEGLFSYIYIFFK
jgi:hypothetical protein